MFGNLSNEELIGRAATKLKAMRQGNIKREWINKPCCRGVQWCPLHLHMTARVTAGHNNQSCLTGPITVVPGEGQCCSLKPKERLSFVPGALLGVTNWQFFSIDKNSKGKFIGKFLVATTFISNLCLLNLSQSRRKCVAVPMVFI